ncbi:TPA: hypothetical protein QHO33_005302 [Citrobacter freundii]|uniref:hypothetical protein n=1 Tax=Citrobacter freundii TaxID=546 RepID=UPI0023B31D42|nr:hypothetical protein [Citrobacter freundii]MDE9640022.1 hypothetical protein [Citrobacter freundii]HDT2575412.1 hypothetical protein [Citrobacter freundii]
MDYSKLSDGEISVRLAYFLKRKYSATIHPHETTGANLSWNWFNTVQNTGYFPLRRAEELFPVMKKHRIGLTPSGKTVWQASHESGISATHRNQLRAVAIVYLLLQESANVQTNPARPDIR